MRRKPAKWTVYALRDPISNTIRYVGWTSLSVKTRLRRHRYEILRKTGDAWTHMHHRATWLRSLLDKGLWPTIEVLESGFGEGFEATERKWIAHFRSLGDLTNTTDGGEGFGVDRNVLSQRVKAYYNTHPEYAAASRAALAQGRKLVWEDPVRRAEQIKVMREGLTSPANAKLTKEQVIQFRAEAAVAPRGYIKRKAAELGIHPKSLSRAICGKTWPITSDPPPPETESEQHCTAPPTPASPPPRQEVPDTATSS